MQPRFEERDGTLRFDVRVAPRASRDAVLGVHDGAIKIALCAPPVEGEANAALIAFVARALGVAKRDVSLVAGASSKHKRLCVEGVGQEALARLLGG